MTGNRRAENRLAGINPQVFAAHFNGVRFYSNCLIHNEFTVSHVILPAMPRAGDGNPVKLALAPAARHGAGRYYESRRTCRRRSQSRASGHRPEIRGSSRPGFHPFARHAQNPFASSFSRGVAENRASSTHADTNSVYRGDGVCATITLRLKSSAMPACSRISVGRLASDIWSILSCSFSSA